MPANLLNVAGMARSTGLSFIIRGWLFAMPVRVPYNSFGVRFYDVQYAHLTRRSSKCKLH